MRDLLLAERHPKTHITFDDLGAGESLAILNDHNPEPLFYETQVEVDVFDVDSYAVKQHASNEFAVTFPKR